MTERIMNEQGYDTHKPERTYQTLAQIDRGWVNADH